MKHSGVGDQYLQSNLIHSIVEEAKICLLLTMELYFANMKGSVGEGEFRNGSLYASHSVLYESQTKTCVCARTLDFLES